MNWVRYFFDNLCTAHALDENARLHGFSQTHIVRQNTTNLISKISNKSLDWIFKNVTDHELIHPPHTFFLIYVKRFISQNHLMIELIEKLSFHIAPKSRNHKVFQCFHIVRKQPQIFIVLFNTVPYASRTFYLFWLNLNNQSYYIQLHPLPTTPPLLQFFFSGENFWNFSIIFKFFDQLFRSHIIQHNLLKKIQWITWCHLC